MSASSGRVLFTDYMFAFEVTSILIIAAMVGAVILARKEPNERVACSAQSLPDALRSALHDRRGRRLLRRNLITLLLSVEIMLNAVNLTFVAFGRRSARSMARSSCSSS